MYKLTKSESIIRLADNACIPADKANTDYQSYLQWLSEGNTPEPADPPSPAELNAPILAQLAVIDQKKVRAMTDAMLDTATTKFDRLTDLEQQAEALRQQLTQGE